MRQIEIESSNRVNACVTHRHSRLITHADRVLSRESTYSAMRRDSPFGNFFSLSQILGTMTMCKPVEWRKRGHIRVRVQVCFPHLKSGNCVPNMDIWDRVSRSRWIANKSIFVLTQRRNFLFVDYARLLKFTRRLSQKIRFSAHFPSCSPLEFDKFIDVNWRRGEK